MPVYIYIVSDTPGTVVFVDDGNGWLAYCNDSRLREYIVDGGTARTNNTSIGSMIDARFDELICDVKHWSLMQCIDL
jgi:hypothetical protein